MPKHAELVYYGFWLSPDREMLQAAIDRSQELVSGGCSSNHQDLKR
jgi:argininosuccinate synthase